jgi:hypothetical protein
VRGGDRSEKEEDFTFLFFLLILLLSFSSWREVGMRGVCGWNFLSFALLVFTCSFTLIYLISLSGGK